MRATPRATPVRKPEEVHLIDGIQDLNKRGLDDLVFQRCDAQRSLPPIGFWNIRPPCGLGLGLLLHWLVPAIDRGMATLCGLVATAITLLAFEQLMTLAEPSETEEEP